MSELSWQKRMVASWWFALAVSAAILWLIVFLTGCTSTPLAIDRTTTTTTMMVGTNEVTTVVQNFHLTFRRMSALQKYQIPELTVGTNFTLTLRGYRNDGGADVSEQLLRAGIDQAMKSGKGGL